MEILEKSQISSTHSTFLSWTLRAGCWIGAILLIGWALMDPRFRDAEGYLEGIFCLPVSTGIGLFILGWGATKSWRAFAFWSALALIGQAVVLQLIDAGSVIRYQHYKPLDVMISTPYSLFLIILAVQTILVGLGLTARRTQMLTWIKHNFRVWQILIIGLVFFFSSATVSREASTYVVELFFAAFVQVVNLGNLVLIGWTLPEPLISLVRQRFPGIFASSAQYEAVRPGSIDRFSVAMAIWVVIVAAGLSIFSYERFPHIPDEIIYLFHARYLANGQLTVPAPPVPEAFNFYMIPYQAENWYSIFPPGWPAVLAVGLTAGVPWLVNPILAGFNILLAYIFLQELYEISVARLTVLLLGISPWYIFMSMNYMAHTFTLTCVLIAAIGIAWARRTGKIRWAWLSGGAIGVVSLIRPLDGLLIAGLLGLWAIGVGGRRLRFPAVAALIMGTIVIGLVVLPYNQQVTGSPLAFPLTNYYKDYFGPKANALGFGPERGLGWAIDPFPGHSPVEAVINANLNIFSINVELFGWSTGSLLLIILLLISGKSRRSDYLMWAVIVVIPMAYSLYWFSGGPDFGARYWYLTLLPLIVLTVRGIQYLEQKLAQGPIHRDGRVLSAVFVLCLLALINFFPWRAIDKYHHYRGMQPGIISLANRNNFGPSLVLIRGDSADYQSAWIYNPLDFQAEYPIYAWEKNNEIKRQVLKAYIDRPVWIVAGPSLTRSGFQLVAGPLSPEHLIAQEND